MKSLDLWRLGLKNLVTAPVRTGLTILGMAIGVGAILAVLALGEAGQAQVADELIRLGIDRVWITASEGDKLKEEHAAFINQKWMLNASAQIYVQTTINSLQREAVLPVIGCTLEYLEQAGSVAAQGKMPTSAEWNTEEKALVGKAAARRLQVGVGDNIGIGRRLFRIIGLINVEGLTNYEAENTIFLPLKAMSKLTNGEVHEIQLGVMEGMTAEETGAAVRLEMEHYFDLEINDTSLQVQSEAAESIIDTFVKVLGWVAAICVVVGGVGVMNILLVSIRERRMEIGMMKAMGTMSSQISGLFLIEAICYAGCGGVLGILLGILITTIAGSCIGVLASVQLWECLTAVLTALGTGIVFGVYPALRASALEPAAALREE